MADRDRPLINDFDDPEILMQLSNQVSHTISSSGQIESHRAFIITDWWKIRNSHKLNKSGDAFLLISAVTYLCTSSGRQTQIYHDVNPATLDASLAICHLITATDRGTTSAIYMAEPDIYCV